MNRPRYTESGALIVKSASHPMYSEAYIPRDVIGPCEVVIDRDGAWSSNKIVILRVWSNGVPWIVESEPAAVGAEKPGRREVWTVVKEAQEMAKSIARRVP